MTGINHVGLTVGDIDAAVAFYVGVFGLEVVAGPMHCDTSTTGAERRADVFGPRWSAMKLAHLLTGDDGGIELFQFVAPAVEQPDETFRYWQTGLHHVALTVEDLDGVLRRLLDAGGRQRTAVYDVHGGALICYCEDPWGNVVEIVSTTYRDLATATTK